jgi:hypothetical protein
MGGVLAKEEKQTPEDVAKQRQVRTEYNNYLNTTQTNTTTDVNTKALTPESGQSILKQLQAGFKWLKDHPTASINEIYANYDAVGSDVKRIVGTDRPKREFKNTTTVIPSIIDTFVNEKKITDAQGNSLRNLNASEISWYTQNQATATQIDFSEETIKFNDKITEIVKDADTIKAIRDKINTAKKQSTSDVVSLVLQQEVALKKRESQTVDVAKGATVALDVAQKVFFGLLTVTICILSGSFAANMAIGRHTGYRVLYFIYGCIPFFAPFVLIYTLYRRIKEGPLPYYSILPVSTTAATTRFGKFLWWPFYWIPDHLSVEETDTFQNALTAITG